MLSCGFTAIIGYYYHIIKLECCGLLPVNVFGSFFYIIISNQGCESAQLQNHGLSS